MRGRLVLGVVGAGVLAAAASAVSPPAQLVDTDAVAIPADRPDIGTVDVGGGQGFFVASVTSAAHAWPDGTRLALYLDTDGSPATGDPGHEGADVRMTGDPSERPFRLAHWDASGRAFPAGTVVPQLFTFQGNTTFFMQSSLVGLDAGDRVRLVAVAGQGTTDVVDRAPESGAFATAIPETVFSPPLGNPLAADTIELAAGARHAAPPRAGRPWTLTFRAFRSDTGDAVGREGLVDCEATLGGKSLKPARRGFETAGTGVFRAPEAACTWQLPASARGKTIRAVVTVQLGVARAVSAPLRLRVG